jgi:hypothetical protein
MDQCCPKCKMLVSSPGNLHGSTLRTCMEAAQTAELQEHGQWSKPEKSTPAEWEWPTQLLPLKQVLARKESDASLLGQAPLRRSRGCTIIDTKRTFLAGLSTAKLQQQQRCKRTNNDPSGLAGRPAGPGVLYSSLIKQAWIGIEASAAVTGGRLTVSRTALIGKPALIESLVRVAIRIRYCHHNMLCY